MIHNFLGTKCCRLAYFPFPKVDHKLGLPIFGNKCLRDRGLVSTLATGLSVALSDNVPDQQMWSPALTGSHENPRGTFLVKGNCAWQICHSSSAYKVSYRKWSQMHNQVFWLTYKALHKTLYILSSYTFFLILFDCFSVNLLKSRLPWYPLKQKITKKRGKKNLMTAIWPFKKSLNSQYLSKANRIKCFSSIPALTKELHLQVMALVHTTNVVTVSFPWHKMPCSCPLEPPSYFAEWAGVLRQFQNTFIHYLGSFLIA